MRRLLLVGVLLFVAVLYAKPLSSYREKRGLVGERRAQVEELRSEQRDLERRISYASSPEAVEREARRLFYVKPGEHLYIVKGIERWQREQSGR
jgi:cell division protein FtsB